MTSLLTQIKSFRVKWRVEQALRLGKEGYAPAARDSFAAALPLAARVFGDEGLYTINVRQRLAYWTLQAGDPQAAMKQYAALLPVRERVSGPEDRNTLSAGFELARLRGNTGQHGRRRRREGRDGCPGARV